MFGLHIYYVYILTNSYRTVLYTGVTNDLARRLTQHYFGDPESSTFTKKYNVHHLLYYEMHNDINVAIAREKTIKGWKRFKKEALIQSFNPKGVFLNEDFVSPWPPK